MKTIIVATDFSENANNALQYAGALAAYANASVVLFNAFQIPVHASNARISAAGVNELLNLSKVQLEKLALEASQKFGIKVDVKIKLEDLSEGLDALVTGVKADLVVMGMHANDWSDRLFGNTTTAIIRSANYPLLVVPPDAVFTEVKKILYAFDSSRLTSPATLSFLSAFASRFKAEVQVFHVVKPKRSMATEIESEKKVCPEIEAALGNVTHSYKDVVEPIVIQGIEKGVKESGADLLVMVPHKLNMWESLLNQSTTRSMCLRTNIPLLILPNPQGEKEIQPEVNN